MIPRFLLRAGAVAAVASMAAVLAPSAAVAADAATSCEIRGGALSWGVKESFRAYISGSIANGSWETSDGAEYDTPDFLWSGATGSVDPETGAGAVSFTGTLHFTGHDGVLDLTLANPTIEFDGQGAAALLLDARSNDMEGEVAVDTEQEWIGDIAVDEDLAPTGGELAIDAAPITLTNSGADAFAGFYEAGAELDPLTLDLDLGDCGAEASTAVADDSSQADAGQAQEQSAAAQGDVPWLPIGVAGAALLVIGLTVGLLIGGRRPARRPAAASSQGNGEEQPADTA
ncbi:HtaA domain-containing protein [Microbacterium halotolerans]|uniref:HtaA domain-containing protein n=1 Tax=Microbacterium halotolerans TaxID=246613 RepID=UPI000E6AB3BF|nr:HtaA domain-containing protein [Microbacterium halotolerans]